MAHNLNFNEDSKEWSFFSTEKAWHNLGQVVAGAKTAEEAIKLAHLDYEVKKFPIAFNQSALEEVPNYKNIGNFFTTVRTDNMVPLGIVQSRYHIVQNLQVFDFFDSIVEKDEAIFETAGALGFGEKIFLTAKLPHYINIKGHDDPTEVYILLTSSHDGSGSVVAGVTPIRVVCNNTLNAALGNLKNKVSIRHTVNSKQGIKEAAKLMGITNLYVREMEDVLNRMNNTYVSDNVAKKLIEQVFQSQKEDSTRIKNIREDVWKAYHMGAGQNGIIGTAYGLYNGISFYLSHKNYNTKESKFKSLYLTGENKLQKSFDLILKAL